MHSGLPGSHSQLLAEPGSEAVSIQEESHKLGHGALCPQWFILFCRFCFGLGLQICLRNTKSFLGHPHIIYLIYPSIYLSSSVSYWHPHSSSWQRWQSGHSEGASRHAAQAAWRPADLKTGRAEGSVLGVPGGPWGQAQAPDFLPSNDHLGETTEPVGASVFLSVKQTYSRGILLIAGGSNNECLSVLRSADGCCPCGSLSWATLVTPRGTPC